LGDCRRLFIAPDGDLTRLPFEALQLDDSRHMVEEYHVSYLSTGRDLLRFETSAYTEPDASLVAADPDFDLAGESITALQTDLGSRGRHSRDLDRNSLHFSHLPGTRREGEQVAALLGVEPLLQSMVLEQRLKACRSPHILHIATHGFFLPDESHGQNPIELSAPAFGERFANLSQSENPLLRSALALAGANSWLEGKSLPSEAEDGLLTAEDVSSLDLSSTDLVVLSACETGLGEVRLGEGVYGLRRAFVLAGAKALVMSLWKVPDQQTQELMEDFYRRILNGEPRSDALRSAQLAMKAKHPKPLYWGAFICQGDPGPLHSEQSDHD
jgi:CHAT domain-containing protein